VVQIPFVPEPANNGVRQHILRGAPCDFVVAEVSTHKVADREFKLGFSMRKLRSSVGASIIHALAGLSIPL